MSDPVRLAHFSDVHLTVRPLGWALRDLRTKRLSGWFNLRALGRGYRFRHAVRVVETMMRDLRAGGYHRVVFSGDATALGFPSEMAHTAQRLHVGDPAMPGLAVPGNHDYYTRFSVTLGEFEKTFAAWQTGERVGDAVYPFAQRVGHVWLIGVNSCTANAQFWDASGEVGAEQRERLAELLGRLSPGPRILVTHYPVCLPDGRPEIRYHDLRDLTAVLKVASDGGVGLWLHGHRHVPYVVRDAVGAHFPIICAGSATQTGRASYGDYTLTGNRLEGVRRVYRKSARAFEDEERFTLDLP